MDTLRTRLVIIKIYWILEGVGALSPSLYIFISCNLRRNLSVSNDPNPLIITRPCLVAFKFDVNFIFKYVLYRRLIVLILQAEIFKWRFFSPIGCDLTVHFEEIKSRAIIQ